MGEAEKGKEVRTDRSRRQTSELCGSAEKQGQARERKPLPGARGTRSQVDGECGLLGKDQCRGWGLPVQISLGCPRPQGSPGFTTL